MGPIPSFVCKTGAGRRFPRVALTGLLLLAAASSEAQQVARQVLLLQSVDRGNMAIDQFTGNFRVELDKGAERPVNVVQVVVGPTGSVGASEQAKPLGLGIGLAIARMIVDAHGGIIDAANNAEGGATLTFILPRRETPKIPSDPPSAA